MKRTSIEILTLIILLNASTGYAAAPVCANALLTSPVTNPVVKSYVELIGYYRKRSTDKDTVSLILESIINSNRPLNPLLNRETGSRFNNSLTIQVSQAIDKLIPSLSADDWEAIRSELKSRRAQWGKQEIDRGQKANETREIFKPKLKEGLCGAPSSAQAPLKQGENTYMIEITHRQVYTLYLIECVNEKQIIRDQIPFDGSPSTPRWFKFGNRNILFIETIKGAPVTFELRNQKLEEIEMPLHLQGPTSLGGSFADPVRFKNQSLLLVGGNNRVALLKLVGMNWVQLHTREIFEDAYLYNYVRRAYPKHMLKTIVGDRLFYSFVFDSHFMVYELIDNELELIFRNQISDKVRLHVEPPVAQVLERGIIIAFTFTFSEGGGGLGKRLEIVDIPLSKDPVKHSTFVLVSPIPPKSGVRWLQGAQGVLLVPADRGGHHDDFIHLLKWNGQDLSQQETIRLQDRHIGTVESFSYMDRTFITYYSAKGDLAFLEKLGGVWNETSRVHVLSTPGYITNYTLSIDQNSPYVVVQDNFWNYRVIDLTYSENTGSE